MARLLSWWKNVSIAKKLYFVVGVMAVLIVCELLTLQFAMHKLSATRALVSAEGLWSKAQKNAEISLLRYGVTKNEKDYESFLEFLKVPEGDHVARLELLKPHGDRVRLRQGFLQGRIHAADVDAVIDLLQRFSWVSYLSQAVAIWTQGDVLLARFKAAAENYHGAIVSGDRADAERTLVNLLQINEELTTLEDQFSYTLGVGSRWLEHMVLTLLSVAVLIVETIGLTLTFLTSRAISKGLNSLNDAAVRIGRGDFSGTIFSQSQDEIGRLGRSVNQMGCLLQASYRSLEARVEARTRELDQSRNQLNIILEGITDGIIVQDEEGEIVYANEIGAKMCGFSSLAEFSKTHIEDVIGHFDMMDEEGKTFPSSDLPARRVLAGLENPSEVVVCFKPKGGGELRWSIVRSAPIFDEARKAKLAVTIFKDFTEHKRAEDALKFLDESSRVLSSSLDYEVTLNKIAELAVSKLADWCAIDLLEDGQKPRSVAVAHPDPEKTKMARRLSEKYPTDWNSAAGSPNVIRTGKSVLYSDVSDEMLTRAARDEEHLAILRELGMKSVMIVPLVARGKTLGAITLISAESGRKFSKAQLTIAEELGRRAGTAVDNASLYKEAQRAIRARDEFLSIASHELKTPLTSLGLQIQMTRKNIKPIQNTAPPPEKLAKVFDLSERQVRRLNDLVEDLLDVSRIQAGKLSFNFENISLSETIKDMVSRFSEQLIKAKCPLKVSIQEGVTGYFDHLRIEQVIDNFLSNAVKYAPGKPVEISLTSVDGNARIVVEDEGPGIQIEKQAKLFERFERATNSTTVSGLGLGLYIVKEVVKGHGGTVQLESKPGHGTKFIVDLPLRANAPLST